MYLCGVLRLGATWSDAGFPNANKARDFDVVACIMLQQMPCGRKRQVPKVKYLDTRATKVKGTLRNVCMLICL